MISSRCINTLDRVWPGSSQSKSAFLVSGLYSKLGDHSHGEWVFTLTRDWLGLDRRGLGLNFLEERGLITKLTHVESVVYFGAGLPAFNRQLCGEELSIICIFAFKIDVHSLIVYPCIDRS